MKEKLSRDQLMHLLDKIMRPAEYKLSQSDSDAAILAFCAGCPDPVKARWLIVECLDPMSDEELVDCALSMPVRKMADVPFTEFPEGHPLRNIAL